jgi:hypothetical protein
VKFEDMDDENLKKLFWLQERHFEPVSPETPGIECMTEGNARIMARHLANHISDRFDPITTLMFDYMTEAVDARN